MQQLSRPYQIALGALLVFALAWFVVLKPSDAAEAVAPAPSPQAIPGAAGLGTAVSKAQGAAASSKQSAAATEAATGEPTDPAAQAPAAKAKPATEATTRSAKAAKSAAPAKAKDAPAATSTDPSAAILRDVAAGKVAVLLFFSPQGADDAAVRRALQRADRHDGKVVVRAASISRVGEYAAITKGVDVLQAPTVLVIGKGGTAHTLVGFTDTRAIDQLVADVGGLRAKG